LLFQIDHNFLDIRGRLLGDLDKH